MKKTVGSTVTQYLLDGDEEIAEYNGTTLLRRYITGPAIDDRIARAEGNATSNPTKSYYRTNHQGSVVATTDAAGTVTQRLAYDEYGLLGLGGVPSDEQFRYTGRRYDPETNLYYYRARYYAPDIGRFLQTDPVGYADDFNLYAYVGNDPANKTDPTGECPACIGATVEVLFQLYTGELQASVSDAWNGGDFMNGDYSDLLVSGAKIGISAASGGLSGSIVKGGVAVAAKGAELASAGAKATTVARGAGVVLGNAANGAATKAATNAVEGKPLTKGVGTAAAVGGVIGTVGSKAANTIGQSAAGAAGANAGNAAKIVSQVISGASKKEANCSIEKSETC